MNPPASLARLRRGVQHPDARSPWRLNFVRWRVMFADPQYEIWRLEVWGVSYRVLENLRVSGLKRANMLEAHHYGFYTTQTAATRRSQQVSPKRLYQSTKPRGITSRNTLVPFASAAMITNCHNSHINTQWSIGQTQQNFIIVLGQHVSILIESSSGSSVVQLLT